MIKSQTHRLEASHSTACDKQIRSKLIHGISHTGRWDYNHHVVPPITSSATFRLDSAERGALGFAEFMADDTDPKTHPPIYVYDRLDEPTRGMLEDNLALAESGEVAVAFASGMAAISASLCVLAKAGEHIVTHSVLYGCTYSLITNWLPRQCIDATLVDLGDLDQLKAAVQPNTRIVYFETPVNPNLRIIDIRGVRAIVDEINAGRDECDHIKVVVDNTFATPFCQRPLELGADVVCQSLTKGIGGFGTDMGGAVIGPHSVHRDLILYRKDFGGLLAPKCAWPVLVQGLPTLATRMVNYQKTAMRVARFLESHPKVREVHYPGLSSFPQHELAKRQMVDDHGHFAPGSVLYFELHDARGTGQPAIRLIDWAADNAYCLTLAVSLGQVKTLIEAPYTMTHATMPAEEKDALGMTPNGVRMSMGLEDWHDIVEDLDEALDQV